MHQPCQVTPSIDLNKCKLSAAKYQHVMKFAVFAGLFVFVKCNDSQSGLIHRLSIMYRKHKMTVCFLKPTMII